MARLELNLLGPFQASLDGREVTDLPTSKVRALLAYLALEADRPHPRTVLAGLLWPEMPESAARRNLRHALSPLRAAIEGRGPARPGDSPPPFLLITRETIQFNPDSDHWLDVAVFRACLEGGEGDEGQAAGEDEAIALYRGPFLEGFSVGDSPEFEDWLILWRERLERQALTALRALGERCEQEGDHRRACEYARRLLELDPLDEQGHRQLMRSLAMSGQRNAALAQFEACRLLLSRELGVEPSPETIDLYERIRDGDIGGTVVGDRSRSVLPIPLFPLVGREEELAQIVGLVRNPTCRLLTLVGPGGIGKTRLAIEAAARLADGFADGVHSVSLAPIESEEGMVPAIARALGFAFLGERSPREQLLGYLRSRHLLLVLDSLEQLLDRAELLAEVLRAAPGVKILATSRARLNLQAEQLFPVPGMRYPLDILSPDLSARSGRGDPREERYSAVELFLESARHVRPGYQPTEDDMQAAVKICQLVEGMPLAILLASSWTNLLSPAELATELSARSLDLLARDWADMPSRQRSMRAVFDYSWNLLGERDREVLSGLSVFRGGFAREAAEAVVGASWRDLMMLADRSLLLRTPAGRYELHELLRQYAGERLETASMAEAVRDRHASYYARALATWEENLKGPKQQGILHEMGGEILNARAGWMWAAARRRADRLCLAANGLGWFHDMRGRYAEAEALFRGAVEQLGQAIEAESAADSTSLRALAQAMSWQGSFAYSLGYTDRAHQALRGALDLLTRAQVAGQDTRRDMAFALNRLGWTLYRIDHESCRRLQKRSVALYRELGDQWELAGALVALAWSALGTDDYLKTRAWIDESLTIRRLLGDLRGVAESLHAASAIALSAGHVEESLRMRWESIAICREIGHRSALADGLAVLGDTLRDLGRFTEALEVGEEGLAIQVELGRRERVPKQSAVLGFTKLHLGMYEQARDHGERSLHLARQNDNHTAIPYCCDLLGCVALVQGSFIEAHNWLLESVSRWRELGGLDGTTQALLHLGCADHCLGQLDAALEHVGKVLRAVPRAQTATPFLQRVSALALLLAGQGQCERAVELYALSSQHPFVANSQWYEDVFGKRIAAAAVALTPGEVAAAQERGRARDLWATATELRSVLGR